MISRRKALIAAAAIAAALLLPVSPLMAVEKAKPTEIEEGRQAWREARQMQTEIRAYLNEHSPLRRFFMRVDLNVAQYPFFEINNRPIACLPRRGALPDVIPQGEYAAVPTFEICAIISDSKYYPPVPSVDLELGEDVAHCIAREERNNMEKLGGSAEGQGLVFFRNDITVFPCFDTKRQKKTFLIHEEIAMAQFVNAADRVEQVQFYHDMGRYESLTVSPFRGSTFRWMQENGYKFWTPQEIFAGIIPLTRSL